MLRCTYADATSYDNISQSLDAVRFVLDLELSDLSEIWQAHRQYYCRSIKWLLKKTIEWIFDVYFHVLYLTESMYSRTTDEALCDILLHWQVKLLCRSELIIQHTWHPRLYTYERTPSTYTVTGLVDVSCMWYFCRKVNIWNDKCERPSGVISTSRTDVFVNVSKY